MNRHPGLFSLALLGIIWTCSASVSPVRGQGAAPAIPAPAGPAGNIDSIKGSPSVATQVPAITQRISEQVARLTGGETAAAREQLIDDVSPGRVAPSPAFLAEYARQLDTGILPALKSDNEQVRLNAAIVVARAAERTDNAALRGATMALLNDKSRSVVLWGLKAARWVIPAILRNPADKANDVLDAVIKAAATHGVGVLGAPIAVEAYEALTVDAMETNPKRRPSDKTIQTVIPYVHQLLQQRAAQYRKELPPEPLADSRGTLFLVDRRVWGLHSPQQKVAGVQAMSDLIGLAVQHVAAATEPLIQENLKIAIGRMAAAIAVIPEAQTIEQQLAPSAKVDQRTPNDQVAAAVAAVVPALKQTKEFAAITPPPQYAPAPTAAAAAPAGQGGAATRPSTAPKLPATAPASAAAFGP